LIISFKLRDIFPKVFRLCSQIIVNLFLANPSHLPNDDDDDDDDDDNLMRWVGKALTCCVLQLHACVVALLFLV
jgi:hypothetical protein